MKSLATPRNLKTHVRNYNTQPGPCAVCFERYVTPVAANRQRDAVHLGTGDDVRTVTLDGAWRELSDAATVLPEPDQLGAAALDAHQDASAEARRGVPAGGR